MTSEELKEEIDLSITSETSPSSITPTDVGETLKTMVDYVDQEVPYSFWRAEINSSSVVRVLYDGIGFTSPTVTNPSTGTIVVTKTGFFSSLDSAKLEFLSEPINNSGAFYVTEFTQDALINPANQVQLNIFDMTGSKSATPAKGCIVEIRIFK